MKQSERELLTGAAIIGFGAVAAWWVWPEQPKKIEKVTTEFPTKDEATQFHVVELTSKLTESHRDLLDAVKAGPDTELEAKACDKALSELQALLEEQFDLSDKT